MPPAQRTFTVIPQAGAGSKPVRPMTSKQVRKAYKASNKAPSMSHAERQRWERAQQERIRKELDRERAAGRAKAARERRREKESAERERRKREGRPLVEVRPSQDTIARFARGPSNDSRRTEATITEEPNVDWRREGEELTTESNESVDQFKGADAKDAEPIAAEAETWEADMLDEDWQTNEPMNYMTQGETKSTKAEDLIEGEDLELEMLALEAEAMQKSSSILRDLGLDAQPEPPLSTQAIFSNLDEYFPTCSQLELEMEEEMSTPLSRKPRTVGVGDKENAVPCSQESYGGGWVEAALELHEF